MSASSEARELKAEGAIEAAQNPDSLVTADQAEEEIVEQSRNAGVLAFKFDPDASPEQKRAQAREAFPDSLGPPAREKGAVIVTDRDDGTGPHEELPEAGTAGVLEIAPDADSTAPADGSALDAEELPYARTGWAPRFGWPADGALEGESLLDHDTWAESKLPDYLYGDWYHNAALIFFACITSWTIAILGGGLAWIVILMTICATYYRTSLRRVRRNFRDDVTRELALKKLETDNESLEWINSFLVKFWPIYQPVLAQTIINSVDQVLSSATPAFLDSLKLKSFTLGSKPPRMEHVKTYPRTEDDIVLMDWKFSFTPNDAADMTTAQLKNKLNPKIVLEIRIGKAMISKGLDVIVENMTFSGIMRLKIKLQIPFPHVDRVEMCFLERPTIDYVCKPLGGDSFGFDINFIPGLESFILEQIHGNLTPMMYAPNVFPIEVAKMLAGNPVDQALGVLALTLHGAQGLKNMDFAGTIDPYASISFGRRQELARTKTVQDSPNPHWNETHYLIVTSFNDSLDIQVFDKNEFRKSKELGVASFRLEDIQELHVLENQRLEIIADGKARGVVLCNLRFFPVLEDTKGPDGKVVPAPPSNQGILRFTVEQAKDLDGTKSLVGLLNPYAALFLNGMPVHQTKKLRRTNNPIWENGSKEILITDRKKAKLGVTVKDEREFAGDQVLGKYQIKLDEILECMEQGKEWYQLSGAQTGRVKMMAQWKPVAISGVTGTGGYVVPIGVMRFHFQKALDLRNFETVGKSDPYVRVLLSGVDKARTVTFRNNLNPEWDEVIYVPIHSSRDRLTLDVMDAEKMGKDRSLGLVELSAGDFVRKADSGAYLVHDVKAVREEDLRLHGKGIAKGKLVYTAAFYPCLNVADPEDDEKEEKAEEGDKKAEEKGVAEEKAANASVKVPAAERSPQAGKFKASLDQGHDAVSRPSSSSAAASPSVESRKPPKIRLSPEELLKYQSGLLIFRLLEAEMPESLVRLEVFVDEMAHASYVSSTAHTKTHKFDEIGDCVIRELDFSRLTLKARKKGDDSDHTLADLTGNTKGTLKQCLNNPTWLKLRMEDNREGWVRLTLKYIPLDMQLDPSESINNMGKLHVDVLDATDLPPADRNGKSDPYCRFELNGAKVHQTKIQKKTLSPVWNESFETEIPSRIAAKFIVNVFDYDFAEKPDFLGAAVINLASLEPLKPFKTQYRLNGASGSLRLRMLFKPDFVTRTRQGSSSLSSTFVSHVSGVAQAPTKGGAAVAQGVGKGASFLRRGIFGGKKDGEETNGALPDGPVTPRRATNGSPVPAAGASRPSMGAVAAADAAAATAEANQTPPIPTIEQPATQNGTSKHRRNKSITASSVHSGPPGAAALGTATITVVAASGYPSTTDLYVVVSQTGTPKDKVVGKTRHYKAFAGLWKFEETFNAKCASDTQFKVEVKGTHIIGKSDDLGEHVYFVDESGNAASRELSVGGGTVTIKSSFQPPEAGSPVTPRSHLRRSFLTKREGGRNSRESTPLP